MNRHERRRPRCLSARTTARHHDKRSQPEGARHHVKRHRARSPRMDQAECGAPRSRQRTTTRSSGRSPLSMKARHAATRSRRMNLRSSSSKPSSHTCCGDGGGNLQSQRTKTSDLIEGTASGAGGNKAAPAHSRRPAARRRAGVLMDGDDVCLLLCLSSGALQNV
jgi:hypothetical protein